MLLVLLLVGVGCGGASLTNPVVAHTGSAETRDGYEAALVTVEAQGYQIATKDREHGYLRVLAKPLHPGASPETYFDIQAMPGRVSIFIDHPKGQALEAAEARRLRRQMEQLAWNIGGRARILGGDTSGSGEWPSSDWAREPAPTLLTPQRAP